MELPGVAERVREVWRWRSSRTLLIVACGITVILSLFELQYGPAVMLRELASNFITCVAITFVVATVDAVAARRRPGGAWRRFPLLLLLLAVGGALGGLVAWGINLLFFPWYHISHPFMYLLLVASLAIVFGLGIEAYQNVADRLDEAVARLARKEVREQKLLRLRTEAELAALRARINPHFLFNTLNSIASLIPEDPERAERTVERLSNLFRYILSASERPIVPLDEELDILTEYLEIEKERLDDRLDYAVERAESLDGVTIPSMILQPLVENSVKYAVMPEREGGSIRVRCRRRGDRCSIEVADTGPGFDPASTREGFGISGVRQRLELTYPGVHEFGISTSNGLIIRIDIPISNEIQSDPG